MAGFDDLPDKILLKIFFYLRIDQIILCIRNVCTRWRKVSEDDALWKDSIFCPDADIPKHYIIFTLENVPVMRTFHYYGTCNVIEKLSECCRRVTELIIPHIELRAALLEVTMERLTELRVLHITISPTEEGLKITSFIGQSETLTSLTLRSSGARTVAAGLLKPIADGCPNLNILKCEAFNLPNSEICYLLQRKKQQLEAYDHYGLLSPEFLEALNECTNLHAISFLDVDFDGPFKNIPPVTNFRNLRTFEMAACRLPMLKIIPLTLFLDTLSHLTLIGITYASANIDDLLNKIILKSPVLVHLDLEGNSELRCRGLRNISTCKMLKHLDVSHCPALGAKAIKYVAEGCPQLQLLDVSGIPMSGSIFRQILRCRNLKALFFIRCDLRGINLKLVSTYIPGLLHLCIGPGFPLSNEALREIKQQMPHLTINIGSALSDKCEV
ncbi:uncharacterized protein LOC111864631 [Cryptotermes secundus]|uniref:uncharacterized protein LOC111864631 n=1 Tax=Cryptotermes secundus TaxID=105785 RepID=UPI000CD7D9F7|nr:uncharacterized protein LOC111864631 [Cryptotermes secundus]